MNRWVVVVDDDAIGLTSAKNMLGEEHMKVSCLRSGSDLHKEKCAGSYPVGYSHARYGWI